MNNDYQKGYKAGFSDGKKGQKSDVRKHISMVKVILSDKYIDDFSNGYEAGHTEGYKKWCEKN